jgi:quercetin dioxygenase-like cupin family protein
MTQRPTTVRESDVQLERWSEDVRGHVGFRTLFGDGETPTSSLTVGVTEMRQGDWLGLHRHSPAEVYYVLDGEGVVTVDGDERTVVAGTAVFIPGDAEHGIRNTGRGLLRFLYAFAVSSFDDVEYRWSALAT